MIQDLSREECNNLYKEILIDNDSETMRTMCLTDLFFLLTVVCRRQDMNRDWIFDRIREVEASPDGHLDLWFRAGYKSSIITYGKTMQDILIDPELTVGIFSHTRPIAKSFASQIKREFESNEMLKGLFPDVLYETPQKDSPKWSLDDGIIVKRKTNPKEATLEAWGLIDGQPTSRHFGLMVYDDVVSRESVTTPEMIAKTTEAYGLSLNLAGENCRKRYIGTRYHSNDTYKTMLQRGTAKPRIYPATHDGTMNGKSVLLTQEDLNEKLRDMGSYVFSCQMLQNPLADSAMGFKKEWLMYYFNIQDLTKWNFYVLVDPASGKHKKTDYTVMVVIGLAPDHNYYLVDGVRDRMNLTQRTDQLFRFVTKWRPINSGYEQYGMQADLEHIKYVQEEKGYRFKVTPLGGSMPKEERIRRLVPKFENFKFFIPHKLPFVSVDGKVHDFIGEFIRDEYETFPISTHDDMLDCIARILDQDLNATFPKEDGSLMAPLNKPLVHDPLSLTPYQQNTNEYIPAGKQTTSSWKELMTRKG